MPSEKDLKDVMLKISEAANLIGVCQNTLRKWCDEGLIPFIATPKGHRRFKTSEIFKLTRPKVEQALADIVNNPEKLAEFKE